jgi:hypothetical protein
MSDFARKAWKDSQMHRNRVECVGILSSEWSAVGRRTRILHSEFLEARMCEDQWRLVAMGESRCSRIPHETRSEPRFLAAALASTLLCLQATPCQPTAIALGAQPRLNPGCHLIICTFMPATLLHAIRPSDSARLFHCAPARRIARRSPLGMKWLDLHREAHDDRLPK